MTPWEALGIAKHSYTRRLRRGYDPTVAGSLARYGRREKPLAELDREKVAKVLTPRVAVDKTYRKSWDSWPMTEDERAVNRVLRGWRRVISA